MDSSRASRAKKSELNEELKLCKLSIKSLDKPNLHSLQELVHGTLPVIGNITRIGKLQLEKAHQVLKRAIRQSNNKDVHIQSVQSAIFNDWQGRLSIQVPKALAGEKYSELGCYRLLFGRESVFALQGSLTLEKRKLVHRMLGPFCCVPALLKTQGKSIISPRVISSTPLKWTLNSNTECADTSTAEILPPPDIRRSCYFEMFLG